LEPLDLLAEIARINKRIREAGRERLELVERFNREIRELVRDFEGTPDTFKVYLDLTRSLQRITRRVEKAEADQSLDYIDQLEKALTVLKKRRFETAIKELDRIPVLGLLTEQRQLFEDYKKGYAAMLTRCESLEAEIREKGAYYESLQDVDVTSFDELAALKEQITAYNDGVGTFLETFVKQVPILDVLRMSLDASYHPELGFPPSPSHENAEKLLSFVLSEDLSSLPLYRVLEYAKYSDSKLSHYVVDTTSFRQVLESNVVWLDSLDDIKRRGALKLSLKEPGVSLAVKIPRLIAFLSKLNAPTGLLTFLRDTQKLVTSGRYERIRATSAVNRNHLEKIQQGAHIDDLRALEDERARLMEQLEDLQEPRAVEIELA
jgi:hypothetical protein